MGAPRFVIAVLTAALLAAVLTSATPPPAQADDSVDTVIIEMRVWQRVDDAENLWVSARPRGGRWDTLGTIPLPEDGRAWSYGEMGRHGYGDVAMAGVAVRVWQRTHEPERIYVQACAGPCPDRSDRLTRLWRPLGKIPLPLDDGHSPGTRYRYGDIDVAVPRGNPGLLADREHLLALRDVLEGDGEELDWSVDRPTAGWEGITVGGTPPRVTGLNLANHGLTGEIWGYLGDLAELTELRLDGNALTGIIPSKLSLLGNLTHVYLAGNALQGCIPPGLRVAQQNDLSAVSLAECPALDTQTVEGGDSEFPDDFPDLDGWFTDLGGGTHYLALWFSRAPCGRTSWSSTCHLGARFVSSPGNRLGKRIWTNRFRVYSRRPSGAGTGGPLCGTTIQSARGCSSAQAPATKWNAATTRVASTGAAQRSPPLLGSSNWRRRHG